MNISAPRVAWAGLIAAGCIASGYAASILEPGHLLILCSTVMLALLAVTNIGVFTGVLVVAILNGIRFLDLESVNEIPFLDPESSAAGVPHQDALVALLVVTLGAAAATARAAALVPRWLLILSLTLALWWLTTFIRTWLGGDIPFREAALYAREYLYFAIVLPLMVLALRKRGHVIGLLLVLAGAAVLAGIGLVASAVTENPSALIHPTASSTGTEEATGVLRVYFAASDLAIALVPFGIGLIVLGRVPILRRLGVAAACLGIAATLFSLTRSLYFAVPLSVLLTMLVWSRGFHVGARRARVAFVAVVIMGLVASAALGATDYTSAQTSPLESATNRLTSAPSEIADGSGTLAYRYAIYRNMFDLLGSSWPVGLGFLHPHTYHAVDLPVGTIRNIDVGFMNVLMPMGAIGLLLLYGLLMRPAYSLIPKAQRDAARIGDWIRFGSMAWVIAAVVASVTVGSLHATPGLVLAAAIITLGMNADQFEARRADER